jgi:hypothetical protein
MHNNLLPLLRKVHFVCCSIPSSQRDHHIYHHLAWYSRSGGISSSKRRRNGFMMGPKLHVLLFFYVRMKEEPAASLSLGNAIVI